MFFSFFKRLIPSKPQPIIETIQNPQDQLKKIFSLTTQSEGVFYDNFILYHNDTRTLIDLLLFLPERGIYFGEKLSWSASELAGRSVERSSKRSKESPATRLESSELRIRRKLEDVLSFDSTPIERFIWMPYLSEAEFDTLDSSFHELLPKGRIIFCNDSAETIQNKFEALAPLQTNPFSKTKVLGSLLSHTLLLPNISSPFGSLLNDEQTHFLNTLLENPITQLCGDYGSGKSTLLLRKAIQILLDEPTKKILILTPTKLGGELLRDEFIALIEYGAFSVNIASLSFYTPEQINSAEYRKHFQESTHIFCDDTEQMNSNFIETIIHDRTGQSLLLCGLHPINPLCITKLINHYRYDTRHHLIRCKEKALLVTLLNLLHKRLAGVTHSRIMVVLDDYDMIKKYKTAIDEYLHNNCRVLTPTFSLQSQNLDDVILSVPECLSGLSVQHLYLISTREDHDYPFILSRASETATIISLHNN